MYPKTNVKTSVVLTKQQNSGISCKDLKRVHLWLHLMLDYYSQA